MSPTGVLHLKPAEDLTFANAQALQTAFVRQLEAGTWQRAILDLSGVSLVDSMGLKLVLGLYKTCQQQNMALEIAGCSPRVAQILSICGLHRVLNIVEASSHD